MAENTSKTVTRLLMKSITNVAEQELSLTNESESVVYYIMESMNRDSTISKIRPFNYHKHTLELLSNIELAEKDDNLIMSAAYHYLYDYLLYVLRGADDTTAGQRISRAVNKILDLSKLKKYTSCNPFQLFFYSYSKVKESKYLDVIKYLMLYIVCEIEVFRTGKRGFKAEELEKYFSMLDGIRYIRSRNMDIVNSNLVIKTAEIIMGGKGNAAHWE
jgi:hypothetical protein